MSLRGVRSAAVARVIAAAAFLPAAAAAQVSTGVRLYAAPDPAATGGMRGQVAVPARPLAAVFAAPTDAQERVYKGDIVDAAARRFQFRGLPVGRYDLLIAFDDAFYEGFGLTRAESSLTDTDRAGIAGIVERSEPFFNEKRIHRLEGTTGRTTGQARCVCTFLRTRSSVGFIDGVWRQEHRRSLKLVWLEDVGPGWQVARTREIYTVMVAPGTGFARAVHNPRIGRIRVTDDVKDLGALDLDAEPGKEAPAAAK